MKSRENNGQKMKKKNGKIVDFTYFFNVHKKKKLTSLDVQGLKTLLYNRICV